LTLLDALFRSISFKELVELVISKLGLSVLVVLFSAYFAAIVFFSALPSKSIFSTEYSQSKAIGFFQQAFRVFSLITILMIFISGWYSFILLWIFYLIIFVPTTVNVIVFRRELTFDEYVKFKSVRFILGFIPLPCITKYDYANALSWIGMLGELLALFYLDPTIPLVGWAVILYSLVLASFQTSLIIGVLSNARSCPYAKIMTVDGIVKGFIIAKAQDHYIVQTRKNQILLSNEHVKSMSPSPLPKKYVKSISPSPPPK
jgi:hypothetical protein